MMEDILENLDAAQQEAVLCRARHVLVAAPPGSGKTRVLVCRLARLILDGAEPGTIAALTFTCKAAMEMAGRMQALLGREAETLEIGTFHALALRILRKARPGLSIIGRAGKEEALRALGVKNVRKTASMISFAKNTGALAEGLEQGFGGALEKYEEYLAKEGLLDLDDLVPEATALLEKVRGLDEDAMPWSRLAHILVDEYQDINAAQVRFLKALATSGTTIFAIGDPDQAIYSFRGASLEFFRSFEQDWPGALVLGLKKNYRSRALVVEASKALIGHNRERLDLCPLAVRPGGGVRLVECPDEAAEARYIIGEIERRMGGLTSLTSDGGMEDARFSDFAVLYRSRRASREILRAFEASSLPFHVAGGQGQGLASFVAALRASLPGPDLPLVSFIERETREAGLEDETRGLLAWLARRYGEASARETLADFIADAEVYRAGPETGIEADKVNLLTLHGAKGLEFRVVFIIGLEEGLIPLCRDDTSIEEERRLFYVGLTRATEEAVLLRAARRRLFGVPEVTRPSPFLDEIGAHLSRAAPMPSKKRRRRPLQGGLFD